MKRLLVIALALLMVAPLAFGKKKRDKAGTMDGATYQDDTYNFSLKVSENWKVRIGDDKDPMRLVMTQKKYDAPTYFKNNPDYTKVPRVALFADTCSMAPMVFIDSLLSTTYKSEFKSEILKELDLMTEPDLVTRSRTPLTISGQPGAAWVGQTKFPEEIASEAGSQGGIRVTVFHGGTIVVIKHGNEMLVFHLMSEWEFFEAIQSEFMTMVNGLTFTAPKA